MNIRNLIPVAALAAALVPATVSAQARKVVVTHGPHHTTRTVVVTHHRPYHRAVVVHPYHRPTVIVRHPAHHTTVVRHANGTKTIIHR